MVSVTMSNDTSSYTYWSAPIGIDLEARDSTSGRQTQSTPNLPMTSSECIQSEAQFRDSARAGDRDGGGGGGGGGGARDKTLVSPVRSPRPSYISIPARWPFPSSAGTGQLPQTQSQDPWGEQSDTPPPLQRRPSLVVRAVRQLSNSLGTIRLMSPPSPDDTAKLQAFHAAVTNYGTLSNDTSKHIPPTPTHLRSPAPPDPSPITTLESAPPSRAGSEVGKGDSWFSGGRSWAKRGGKERERGSSSAVVVAEPDQLDPESPLSPPATPRNDDLELDDNDNDGNDKRKSIACVDNNANPKNIHIETDKWRNNIPTSQTLPPPHFHPSPPPSPRPFCKGAASFLAAMERLKPEPAMVLENSGSVARDHLACERTYLAYVRTSLAIASTGVGGWPDFSYFYLSLTDYFYGP